MADVTKQATIQPPVTTYETTEADVIEVRKYVCLKCGVPLKSNTTGIRHVRDGYVCASSKCQG